MPIATPPTQDYQLIGQIQKAQGLKGHFVVSLENPQLSLPNFHTLFVYMHGTYVPYLVDSCQIGGRYALLRCKHITTRTQALQLRGLPIFLLKSDMKKDAYALWIGCRVEDVHQGVLGPITYIHPRPIQPLVEVAYQNKKLLIPLDKHFFKNVDIATKRIKVSLPKGHINVLG